MTYWRNAPVTWAADTPVHAHITRKVLQDNLQCVYGDGTYPNGGYDFDFHVFNDTQANGTVGLTWAWIDEFYQFFMPIYQTAGGGWRQYYVEPDVYGPAGSTLRIFMLQHPGHFSATIDAATGLVEGVDSYIDISPPAVYALPRTGDTITIGDAYGLTVDGQQIPGVWIHMAGIAPLGGVLMGIRALRIKELI